MLCCALGSRTVGPAEHGSYVKRETRSHCLILFLRRSIKMRRVSSLNDLMNFRQALQIRPPGSLDRPKSVFLNEVCSQFQLLILRDCYMLTCHDRMSILRVPMSSIISHFTLSNL